MQQNKGGDIINHSDFVNNFGDMGKPKVRRLTQKFLQRGTYG